MPPDMAALLELARSLSGSDISDESDKSPTSVAYVAYVATATATVAPASPVVDGGGVAPARAAGIEPTNVGSIPSSSDSARDISDKSDKSWRRLWRGDDPNRRCWTCGARSDHRFPDGSPAYTCHLTSSIPHVPVVAP